MLLKNRNGKVVALPQGMTPQHYFASRLAGNEAHFNWLLELENKPVRNWQGKVVLGGIKQIWRTLGPILHIVAVMIRPTRGHHCEKKNGAVIYSRIEDLPEIPTKDTSSGKMRYNISFIADSDERLEKKRARSKMRRNGKRRFKRMAKGANMM